MKKNTKGQVAGIQSGFMALMFVAIALVVVIIIAAFGADFVTNQKETLCAKEDYSTFYNGECYICTALYPGFNSSALDCYESVGNTTTVSVGSVSTNITSVGLQSMDNLSEGTGDVTDVGIITIVLSLLVSLIGIFGYMGYKKIQE